MAAKKKISKKQGAAKRKPEQRVKKSKPRANAGQTRRAAKTKPPSQVKPLRKVKTSAKARPSVKAPRKPLKIIRTVVEMKKYSREARTYHRKIALVPTMGYLHEGHLSLIREARRRAQIVVVSLFVNPTQFAPTDDLDRYPRDFAGDRRKVLGEGADVLFVPEAAELYPEGFQTVVEVTEVTRDFCGASRPGHFRGVVTVVTKLFNIVRPDLAVFGEKDYQQLICIRQMVRDLNLDVEIIGMPTLREEDGLAMSSRNTYLSPAQRQQSTAIYRGLRKARRLCESGERDSSELTAAVLDLLREESELSVEYVAVCDPRTLQRIPEVERDAVLLAAVRIGDTRLIDNIRLGSQSRK